MRIKILIGFFTIVFLFFAVSSLHLYINSKAQQKNLEVGTIQKIEKPEKHIWKTPGIAIENNKPTREIPIKPEENADKKNPENEERKPERIIENLPFGATSVYGLEVTSPKNNLTTSDKIIGVLPEEFTSEDLDKLVKKYLTNLLGEQEISDQRYKHEVTCVEGFDCSVDLSYVFTEKYTKKEKAVRVILFVSVSELNEATFNVGECVLNASQCDFVDPDLFTKILKEQGHVGEDIIPTLRLNQHWGWSYNAVLANFSTDFCRGRYIASIDALTGDYYGTVDSMIMCF